MKKLFLLQPPRAVSLLVGLSILSCVSGGEDPAGPGTTTGSIAVSNTTVGPDAPATYMVALDGGAPVAMAANAATSFASVAAGAHTVALSGLPVNCTASGTNPRSTTVTAGQASAVVFAVSCVALTGGLDATTRTTGADLDPDGYSVSFDGAAGTDIGVNDSLAFVLPVGQRSVALSGVAANCMVMGANPRTEAVAFGATTVTAFEIACDATTGVIAVSTATAGADVDADGYTVDLDGMASQPIATDGMIAFSGVAEGPHSLTLTGIATNCSVDGTNPVPAVVVAGDTVSVGFDLTCSAVTGDLRVTANTAGSPIDPDGFTAAVDGGTASALAVNGDTITFAAVAAGDRSVLLGDIAPGCTVSGANPVTASVPAGGGVLAVFDVACTTSTGGIELTTVTTGMDVDPDGYMVSLDGGTAQAIGTDASTVFDGLSTGGHSLLLSDVAPNCSVQGANPEMPIVMADDTTDVTMTVACVEVMNSLPTASISAPDTTSSVAPFSAAPGAGITFTGAATDPEDGTLTGASLVWTSNIDGQIGTGETFMTSALSEGQHTVTLTATDSEAGQATETTLVIVVPAPQPGFQITLRLSEGVTLTPGQRTAIDDAVAKLESVITGDVANAFLSRAAGSCASAQYPPISETVDDVLIYLSIVPIDGPGNILGAAGPCIIRGSALPVLGGMRFDSADLAGLEAAGLIDELLLHEAMHVLGFGTLWSVDPLDFLHEPSNPGSVNPPYTPGMTDTYFNGPEALARFDSIGGGSYTGGNVVPVENDTASFSPGSLDGHWREGVFDNEIMTPAVNPGANPLSVLTAGQFQDLGYTVDFGAADAYNQVFTLREGPEAPQLILKDDIYRGPLWMVYPGGALVRVR